MKRLVAICFAALFALLTVSAYAGNDSLIKNGDFQSGEGDTPQDWPTANADTITYPKEGENRFLRLKVGEPGKMVLVYKMIMLKPEQKAFEFSYKVRCDDIKVGDKAWFDGRIMIVFKDDNKKEVKPAPGAPYWRGTKKEWTEGSKSFIVPEGAKTLELMFTLFNAKAGTLDFDDVSLKAIDPADVAAKPAPKKEKAAPADKQTIKQQSQAAERLNETGSIISNGGFEQIRTADGKPLGWGGGKGVTFENESGNHFMRITSGEPGEMPMAFQEIPIPANVPALEMSWKYRLTNYKRGELPWYDARIIMKFVDASGKVISDAPPAAAGKVTESWVERKTSFLVPEGAVKIQWMPTLFRAEKGTFDIDDVAMRATDPAELLAAKAQHEKEVKARYVPPEEAKKEKWPSMLHVEGNHLANAEGKTVWLQGVNAGGLETLPHDMQTVKSVVVAIDDWKSNAVRLPMNETFWFGRDPTQKDGGKEYREKLDQIITLTANRGAYLILDLHRFRAPKAEHVEFWKDAAARYKNHPAVLFDLFNEPHDVPWAVWQKGGTVGKKSGVDESAFLTEEEKKKNQMFESVGMQALIDAVRSTGAKNIVIAGGLAWAGDLSGVVNGYALSDPDGNGIMYSWHQYNWHKGWDRTVLPVAEKYPIFVGEVGADVKKMDFIPKDIQEDPYTWVPDMLGFIQKHKLNWTAWCLHPKATPVLITDWSYTPSPFWGVFAKEALAGKQFEMKKMR